MATLSNRANDLSIGNGGVTNFLGALTHRACNSGLFSFTTAMNFRRANTVNNYMGGAFGRYDYSSFSDGEIDDTTKAKVSLQDGTLLGRSYLYHSYLGEGYTTDQAVMNSGLRFISTDEFTNFGYLLRELLISRNYNEDYNVEKYGDNAKFIAEDYERKATDENEATTASTLPYTRLGDQFNINGSYSLGINHPTLLAYGERFREVAKQNEEIVKDGVGKTNDYDRYKITAPDAKFPFDEASDYNSLPRERNFTYAPDRGMFAALELDEKYRELTRENLFVKNNIDNSVPENFKDKNKLIESLNFGNLYETPTDFYRESLLVKGKINSAKNGVFEYYSKEREKYSSRLNSSLAQYPSGWRVYSYKNLYQRPGSPESDFDVYKVGSTAEVNGTISAGTYKFVTAKKQGKTFSYYQEAEATGYPSSIRKTDTADNSSVVLDTFNNASRIVRETNRLFSTKKAGTLINRFHTVSEIINPTDSDVISSYDKTYGMSRGRNLLTKAAQGGGGASTETGYENPYCRVWTAHHQYSKVQHRIRPFYEGDRAMKIGETQKNYGGMRPHGTEILDNYSVLKDNGYVRITPTENSGNNIKNYMFSIENLAWKDCYKFTTLSPEQQGENGGRIMWFPPYNLKFSENVNTEWMGNKFIGRGEQIYTYVNTERAGTLSFTLLIDHPSILNKWARAVKDSSDKEARDLDILRYFAGCGDLGDTVSGQIKGDNPYKTLPDKEEKVDPNPAQEGYKKIAYVVFFPNNYSGKDDLSDMNKVTQVLKTYETAVGANMRPEDSDIKNKADAWKTENTSEFNLNDGPAGEVVEQIRKILSITDPNIEIRVFDSPNGLTKINSEFTGDKTFGQDRNTTSITKIETAGFASSHGYETNNDKLVNRRKAFIEKYIATNVQEAIPNSFTKVRDENTCILKVSDDDQGSDRNINSLEAKISRAALAIFHIEWKTGNVVPSDEDLGQATGTATTEEGKKVTGSNELDKKEENSQEEIPTDGEPIVVTAVVRPADEFTFDNEYLYFQEIKDGEGGDLVKKNIMDKVRYFDPAFHSITPEGFNARLTFLHQCTRQGPTNSVSQASKDDNDFQKFAGNLSFGRPPYCILRIGDFFNTKICIDSLSISYETAGGVTWDLNQEGIGVQPMFADININFRFLGGQDIGGVVEVLQNAITSNYYANASVYDNSAKSKNK